MYPLRQISQQLGAIAMTPVVIHQIPRFAFCGCLSSKPYVLIALQNKCVLHKMLVVKFVICATAFKKRYLMIKMLEG